MNNLTTTGLERNKVKTQHLLTIQGRKFEVTGYHEYAFKQKSVMVFDLHLLHDNGNKSGRKYIKLSNIRTIAAELISNDVESQKRAIYRNRFAGMDLNQVMAHSDFRYGRIIVSETYGNSVNIYCEDIYSPTSVSLVMGCTEQQFNEAAKATNNTHNYVVGNEGRRIAP